MKVQRKLQLCGTPAGYAEHLRKNERPCRYCLLGSSTYIDEEIRALIQNFRENQRDKLLWGQYGLSHATFERILAAQDNRCACCKSQDAKSKNGWHVDHDHETGVVRGILCSNCNTGIGMLGDDLVGVHRAVEYLKAHVENGGHPRDSGPPKYRSFDPKPSKRMLECFNLFALGVPPNKAILTIKVTPDLMNELYSLWKKRDGQVVERVEHYLRINKEPPRRCYCVCGYAVPFEPDLHSMVGAIDLVNEHIMNSQSAEMVQDVPL